MESNVFHDSRNAGLLNPEHADDKFGSDQAETHMVKLVDGKLVPTADTESIAPDSLLDQYANDEEMAVNGPPRRTYDQFDAGRDDNLAPTDEANQASDAASSEGPQADMIPAQPGNPIPTGPETPTPPDAPPHTPEITPLPSTPQPTQPEITEPSQPGRSHEINNR